MTSDSEDPTTTTRFRENTTHFPAKAAVFFVRLLCWRITQFPERYSIASGTRRQTAAA